LAEWLVENGIGESRAILIDAGHVIAARMEWPDRLIPGEIANAVLKSRRAGSSRGTVLFSNGEEALIDGLPRHASEGARVQAMVTRSAIAEAGRFKRAQARFTEKPLRPAPSLAESLRSDGSTVRAVTRFPDDPWPGLIAEALDGTVAFEGGAIVLTPTPAMTLIDIDGILPPRTLALAAVPAIATAIRQFDVGGSIGIDFPSLEGKDDRRAVDEALASALEDWPHQRTAMNGFGFVQLVARLERPSILHRVRQEPAAAAARLLLRRAEAVGEPGSLLLTAHPQVCAAITPDWRDELARRTARTVRMQDNAGLALDGGFAQALTS
jgi:hypothetical protein